MKVRSIAKKTICIFLIAIIIFANIAYAAADIDKNESVYVTLDQNGKPKEVIVSDWLHSDVSNTDIYDRTILDSIENVKGEEVPIRNGSEIIWKARGNDIYYMGASNKKLPLDIRITYCLEGKQISPEKLAGKSGKVKIKVQFINTESHQVVLTNGPVDMYTPMTVAATVNLPLDSFKNISVNEGKIFSEGNNQVVTFVALPGLKESLDLDNSGIDELKDLDLPDTLEITADAEEFELGPMMFVAAPELPNMEKLKKTEDFDEMKDNLKKLDEAIHDIDEIDPKKEIRSLITDSDKVSASRLLIGDAFDFYDMDKALLDLAPDYVTKENIELYDRVKTDIDDVDIDYILDNKTLRSLPDRLTDESVNNSRLLVADADDLKTLDKKRLEPFLDVLKTSYSLESLMNKTMDLTGKVENNEEEIYTLQELTQYSDKIFGLIDGIDSLGIGGMLSGEDIEVGVDAIFANKKKQLTSIVKTGTIPNSAVEAALSDMTVAAFVYQEDVIMDNPIDDFSIMIIDQAIASTPPNTEQSEKLKQLKLYASLLVNNPDSLGGAEQVKAAEAAVKSGVVQILETQKKTYLKLIGSGNVEPIKNNLIGIIDQAMDAKKADMLSKLPALLSGTNKLKKDISSDLGSNYIRKIKRSLGFADSVMPTLSKIIREYKKHDQTIEDTLDVLTNTKEMDYLRMWAPKLMDMKDDMDKNDENLQLLKDLIKEYDDPKIRHMKDRWKDLQTDFDEIRPIMKTLKERLEDERLNRCLHESPEQVATLLKMKKDLEDNRSIIETLDYATSDRNVELTNKIINDMDEMRQNNDIGEYIRKLDDIDILFQKKDAIVKLSEDYGVFTAAGDNVDTTVKFIIKTDEIKRPEPVETAAEAKQEDDGFFVWLKQLFRRIFKRA